MVEPAAGGRVFRAQRQIRLSDTTASGRLRLDAAARYVQDVAVDDVAAAGLEDGDHVWIVRRATLEVTSAFCSDRAVDLETWSGGLGARWATRRTRIRGDAGGQIEAETTWVFVHNRSLKLARLPASYHRVYGDPSRDAAVSGKLSLPPHPPADTRTRVFPLRVTDIDILGHVNNAVYWEAVESELAGLVADGFRCTATVEYRQPLDLGADVELRIRGSGTGFSMWFISGGTVAAVAAVQHFGPAG